MIDQKSLAMNLDKAGYIANGILVYTAHDFQSAIKAINSKDIDVVTLNLDSQPSNSCALIKQLKHNVPKSGIPFLVTSVQTNAKIKRDALQSGADLFIEQPLPRNFFIEKIKESLNYEVRDNARIDVLGSVAVHIDKGQYCLDINDLSSTGVLIDHTNIFKEGQNIEITMSLEGLLEKLIIDGQVVRIFNKPDKKGVGIKFQNLRGKVKNVLHNYIRNQKIVATELKYYL